MGSPLSHDRLIRPPWFLWVAVIGGLALVGALGFSPNAHAYWAARLHSFPAPSVFQWVLGVGLAVHAWEGWYCYRVATDLGMNRSARAWAGQSALVGYPSTRLLLHIRRDLRAAESTGASLPPEVL